VKERKRLNKKKIILVLIPLIVVASLSLFYFTGDSFKYRHRNKIENAILETFPEGMSVGTSTSSGGVHNFRVVFSSEYFSFDEVGYAIEKVNGAFLEAIVETRVGNSASLEVLFFEREGGEVERSIEWRTHHRSIWGPYGYREGASPQNVGGLILDYGKDDRLFTIIRATELQRVISIVFNMPDLIPEITERLYELFPEQTEIYVTPMWKGPFQKTFPSSLSIDWIDDDEWDTDLISIIITIDPELIPISDFGRYVRDGTLEIHSLLEEWDLTVYHLGFTRDKGIEDRFRLSTNNFRNRGQSRYTGLRIWFDHPTRIEYEDVFLDDLQSIIDQYWESE